MSLSIDPARVTPDRAAELLADIDHLRRHTRRELRGEGWMWMLVWGVVFAGAALSSLLGPVLHWYWLVAFPAGMAATFLVDRRPRGRAGVRPRDWPYVAVGVGMAVLTFGGGALLDPATGIVWCWLVVGVGFSAFAWLEDLRVAAATLLVLALLTVAVGGLVDDPLLLYRVLATVFAVVVSMCGLAMRATRLRRLGHP